ncbi:hypothetical protein U9M48_010707 [Paspalum notatum var. saurae]|uniref:Uncharacterized protein n=1 Tax=Paspalum notatum var. saurae TaxID=547442 RepID=A0AAQ3STL2_PASNO
MASAAARSGLRSLAARAAPARRRMSSVHDDARAYISPPFPFHETAKWEKITYAGIVTCTLLAAYNLSKGHPHFDEPPAYPYLHIRNKEFPWGPDGLFEKKDHH